MQVGLGPGMETSVADHACRRPHSHVACECVVITQTRSNGKARFLSLMGDKVQATEHLGGGGCPAYVPIPPHG